MSRLQLKREGILSRQALNYRTGNGSNLADAPDPNPLLFWLESLVLPGLPQPTPYQLSVVQTARCSLAA